jgi:hypothetical protein
MPTFDTVYDAFCFTLAGILLALITMRSRRDLRAGSIPLIGLLVVGLTLLWVLYQFGEGLAKGPLAMTFREVLLLLITVGFARIAIAFLFKTLLRKTDIPRILADVLFVLVLIAYAIYRLHVAGVNPTSLGVSAAAIGTGRSREGRACQPVGGIAVQLDNTARRRLGAHRQRDRPDHRHPLALRPWRRPTAARRDDSTGTWCRTA